MPSPLKKMVYKWKGYRIAPGVKLSLGCVIIGQEVEIGQNSSVGFFTIIRARQIHIKRFVKIGAMTAIDTEKLFIDDDARINEQVYIGGTKFPDSSLTLGKRTIIMQMSYINPSRPIVIGDDSGIGGHCLMFTHGSWNSQLDGFPVKFAPIHIGKKVWLPWRVFVMPGVTIGDETVVAADSMINKDVPANSLIGGSPAKIIKENFTQRPDEASRLNMLDKMLEEFVDYLKHHEFDVVKSFNKISIQKNKIQAEVFVGEISINEPRPKTNNHVWLLTKGAVKDYMQANMCISIDDNNRRGTSPVGEELVTFLSRYGVRFNRID